MKVTNNKFLYVSFLCFFIILLIGVGCGPRDNIPTNPNIEVPVDSWYTEGFTKGSTAKINGVNPDASETDMLEDLINSFINQVKNASTLKVNQQYPSFSLDMGFLVDINGLPGRIVFQTNDNINDHTKKSLHLAIYKGEGSSEELFLQINVLPDDEEFSDLFIALSGSEGTTKIAMKIFSSLIDSLLPISLGSTFDSSVTGIAQVVGGAIDFGSAMKYEYKKHTNNSYIRHYNITIDLKVTLMRLVRAITGVPQIGEFKADLDFFLSNILGIDSTSDATIQDTMPPVEIELDFITEKGLSPKVAGDNTILTNLSLKCIVSEDISTKSTNTRFKGERIEAEILWDKIIVRRNVLNDNMPGREELLIEDPNNPDPDSDLYVMYNHNGPLAIMLEGTYEDVNSEKSQKIHIGFKYNYYQPDGSDDEFCFRVFDSETKDDIFSLYYKDNIAYFVGLSDSVFSFPFNSSTFLNGESSGELLDEEGLFFKLITYSIGAVELLSQDGIVLRIELKNLTEVLGVTTESLSNALNQAYTQAGGDGKLTDLLISKGVDIQQFMNSTSFVLRISLDDEFIQIFESLPDLVGLGVK